MTADERRREDLAADSGATAIEYSIMAALVAAVIILMVIAVGQRTEKAYSSVCDAMADASIGTATC